MNNLKMLQTVDFSKIPSKNFVFENCTSSTRPESPVGGMAIYESDTGRFAHYDAIKGSWAYGSNGPITFLGVVGGESEEALSNLPTENVSIGDAYYVGADGDYGPSGFTQHALVGDFFFCKSEATDTEPVKWSLVPSGNGRLAKEVTIADGTTEYTITNTLGTADVQVTIYDEDNSIVMCGSEVTESNITISIAESVSTEFSGKTLKIVACAG